MLQLCERKQGWQQIKAQGLRVDMAPQHAQGIFDHRVMIGVEFWQLVKGDPLKSKFLPQRVIVVLDVDERTVGY